MVLSSRTPNTCSMYAYGNSNYIDNISSTHGFISWQHVNRFLQTTLVQRTLLVSLTRQARLESPCYPTRHIISYLRIKTPRKVDPWLSISSGNMGYLRPEFITAFEKQTNVQWNLSVTTTSIIKFITCDLFSNVFLWWLKVPIFSC